MKTTREKRKDIANAQKLVDIIGKKVGKEKEEKKIDLSGIAKDLANRREQVLEQEKKED